MPRKCEPSLLSDEPLLEATEFNFDVISDTLLSFIVSAPLDSPFNICIDGTWGSGKTTLLNTLNRKIELCSKAHPKNTSDFTFIPIWFEPWKLADETEVLTALVGSVLQHIEQHAGLLERAQIDVDQKDILRLVSQRLFQVNPNEISSYFQWTSRQRGTFLEVEKLFRKIAKTYLQNKRRFIIFIDDLDRCPPKRVVAVLETVKLFFDMPGFICLFALDLEQIEHALLDSYSTFGPREAKVYLEKVFQLTYHLPRKDVERLAQYVSQKLQDRGLVLHSSGLVSALIETFGRNLRNLNLFINKFSFQRHLIGESSGTVDDEVLFKWLYLETTIPHALDVSLRRKSLGLVIALEFLAQGARLDDLKRYNKYARYLINEQIQYVPLVIYALLPVEDSEGVLNDDQLKTTQREVVEALRADEGILNTLTVLREGGAFLLDCDLTPLAYLSRRDKVEIEIMEKIGLEVESDQRLSFTGDTIISAPGWDQLGDIYGKKGSNRSAYLCYLMALLINPTSEMYWSDLGNAYRSAGNYRAATALYKIAMDLSSPDYILPSLINMYDLELGEQELGTLLYRKSISTGNVTSTAPFNLAVNLKNQKNPDLEGAFYAALHAFKLEPTDPKRRSLLQELAGKSGRTDLDFSEWNEKLANILDSAAQRNIYPRALTQEEEKRIASLVTDFPNLEEVKEEICTLPY